MHCFGYQYSAGGPDFGSFTGALRYKKAMPNAQPTCGGFQPIGPTHGRHFHDYEAWFDPTTDIEYAVNMLLSSDAVTYAEPLYAYPLLYDPADTDTADQYYLSLMQLRQAWGHL